MSAGPAQAAPPPPPLSAAPMFDLRQFIRVLPVMALRLHAREVERAVRALRPLLLDLPRVKHCQRVPVGAAAVLGPEAAAGGAAGPAATAAPAAPAAPAAFDPEDPRRYLLLHQGIADASLAGATPEQAEALRAFLAAPPAFPAPPGWPLGLERFPLTLGYEHLTAEAALRQLLPPTLVDGVDVLQTGFEIVGHLAHMNLKDEFLPHKAVIGRVVLDKNPSLRCVVNKTAEISTQFRTFPMEVIAGEDDTRVRLRHAGAHFAFDFRAVYWNSRLQHEHEVLVRELLPPGALIADAFAGVGPFAVPAAMPPRACTVRANDLNPASHAALREAVARNRVGARVRTSCLDGRSFLAATAAAGVPYAHAIMNLPADALSFCDVYVGLLRRGAQLARARGGVEGAGEGAGAGAGEANPLDSDAATRPLPRVHLYCFARSETEAGAADDALARLLQVLGLGEAMAGWQGDSGSGASGTSDGAAAAAAAAAAAPAPPPPAVPGSHLPNLCTPMVAAARARGVLPDLLIRWVRNVAPAKHMLCVSFSVPRGVACAAPSWAWVPSRADVEAVAEEGRGGGGSSGGGSGGGGSGAAKRQREAAAGAAAGAEEGAAGAVAVAKAGRLG